MYENTYDPYISGGLFESVDMESETMRAIKGAYDQSGVRLWVLNPDWYVSLGAQYHYSGVFARVVARAVLEEFMVRRTIATHIDDEDMATWKTGAGVCMPALATD